MLHLYCHNATAVVVFQAGRGKDPFLEASTRQLWLVCAQYDIMLDIGHVEGKSLLVSADELSRQHLGKSIKTDLRDSWTVDGYR